MRGRRIDGSEILNPGLLRHQIIWQRKWVSGQDSMGADVYDWADVVSCRARVRALPGTEIETAEQKWSQARYEITQHRVPGLSTAMRIVWNIDGERRILDVLDVDDPVGTGRYQVATAKNYEV